MDSYNIIKSSLENTQISADAYDVISSLIDGNEDEEYTIENYLYALEDGELLAFIGATQEAVEEAYDFLENLVYNK